MSRSFATGTRVRRAAKREREKKTGKRNTAGWQGGLIIRTILRSFADERRIEDRERRNTHTHTRTHTLLEIWTTRLAHTPRFGKRKRKKKRQSDKRDRYTQRVTDPPSPWWSDRRSSTNVGEQQRVRYHRVTIRDWRWREAAIARRGERSPRPRPRPRARTVTVNRQCVRVDRQISRSPVENKRGKQTGRNARWLRLYDRLQVYYRVIIPLDRVRLEPEGSYPCVCAFVWCAMRHASSRPVIVTFTLHVSFRG